MCSRLIPSKCKGGGEESQKANITKLGIRESGVVICRKPHKVGSVAVIGVEEEGGDDGDGGGYLP